MQSDATDRIVTLNFVWKRPDGAVNLPFAWAELQSALPARNGVVASPSLVKAFGQTRGRLRTFQKGTIGQYG